MSRPSTPLRSAEGGRRGTRALALAAALLAAAPAARAAPAGSPWNAAYFGNTVLVTQDGKPVKLHDDLLAGRRVVIAFVDPRCDGECGLVTANLVRIRRLLGDRVGRDLFFYTVSVDPRATPESLRAYAAAYKADWTFLAGSEADLLTVRGKFGDHAPLDVHSPRIAVGNETTGEWMTQGGLDNPAYLAGVLGNWLDPAWATRRDAVRSYAEAPAIAKPTQGELLWRQKCAACHAPGGKSVGPSLAGVTERRARGWLVRFIADPKGLARSGDPDARALAAAYQAAPMPKLGLGEEEADAVVSYLEHGAGRP